MYTKRENKTLGKMEGCESELIANVLYELCGVSGYDEQVGDVQYNGWYALVRGKRYGFIVSEDSQGFFSYDVFGPDDDIESNWALIESIASDLDDEPEEDDDDIEVHACAACDGELVSMGTLGSKTWYRCRHCGMDQAEENGS